MIARAASRVALCLVVAAFALALGACHSKKHKDATTTTTAAPADGNATKAKSSTPMDPHDMPYRVIDGEPLIAHVFSPRRLPKKAPPEPAILLFHPGGWEAGSAKWNYDDARRFAEQGFVAIAVDYRLANAKRSPVAAFEDACTAFAWVRRYAPELGVDPKRVAGYGESAGGQLVAATGTVPCPATTGDRATTRPDLMILVSPMLDTANERYTQLLHGERAVDYSPLKHAGAGTPPTLIVHGTADTLVPTATAQAFCGKLRAAHVDCMVDAFAGVGHLLTRDLKDQEGDIDPDPGMLADSRRHQREFLLSHQFVPVPPAPKGMRPSQNSKATRP